MIAVVCCCAYPGRPACPNCDRGDHDPCRRRLLAEVTGEPLP